MANTSNWKNFEKEVAKALGGKRRLRTMESYGKEAPDVYFTKEMRKHFPKLGTLAVECKKRKSLNVHKVFSETKLKYGRSGKLIIFASRIPQTEKGRKKWHKLAEKLEKKTGQKLSLKDFTSPLVTVELSFFKELFSAWVSQKENNEPRRFAR